MPFAAPGFDSAFPAIAGTDDTDVASSPTPANTTAKRCNFIVFPSPEDVDRPEIGLTIADPGAAQGHGQATASQERSTPGRDRPGVGSNSGCQFAVTQVTNGWTVIWPLGSLLVNAIVQDVAAVIPSTSVTSVG